MGFERLGDLMNAPTDPYALQPSRTRKQEGHIELQGLAFRYSDSHPWLGAGKTAIAELWRFMT